MKYRWVLAALTVSGLLISTGSPAARERLALRVTPNVSNAPSTVIVKATIAPNAENRLLVVEADSGTFFRSSAIELEGDKAPSVTELMFKGLPSGEYTVTAVLRNAMGDETMVRRTALVLARFGEQP